MFTTPVQKIGFVVGCFWLLYVGVGYTQGALVGGNPSELLAIPVVGLIPVTILWWATGTLKPVLNWFKGK